MATADSIQFAISTTSRVNNIKATLRSVAEMAKTEINSINSILADAPKKAVLLDGLQGIQVDAPELKAEVDALEAVSDNVLSNVPALTK